MGSVRLALREAGGRAEMVIQDDGTGFDAQEVFARMTRPEGARFPREDR